MEDLGVSTYPDLTTPFGGAFAGRRVLLTGHTGFKGSWLALWLTALGADVMGWALEPKTQRDHFVLAGLDRHIEHVVGDIRDLDALAARMAAYEPEVVFHLAAQAVVRDAYEQPAETFETNVLGTVNVLEAVRRCASVRAAVIATSDKCYENVETERGYREDDRLGGRDPYSASKACAELAVAAYRRSFFGDSGGSAGVATVRAGNVIGGGDRARDRIVPDCVRALEAGEMVRVRNPDAVRPFVHVLEPLSGYLLLAQRLLGDPAGFSEAFNFGPEPDSFVTVRDLVSLVLETWGEGTWEHTPDPDAPHEAGLLYLDVTKARDALSWRPSLTTGEAVRMAVEWYRRAPDEDVHALGLEQIAAYTAAARGAGRAWAEGRPT